MCKEHSLLGIACHPAFSSRMLLFLCFRWYPVLTTEKPTVIDNTIQSGIKYQEKIDSHMCLLPQNSASLCFSVCISHQSPGRMPPASGPQAGAINTASLSSTCICSREQDFLPISHCQMVTIPTLNRARNILCFKLTAHLGHGLCLQTQEKEISQAAAWLFIFIAALQIGDRRSLSVCCHGVGSFTATFPVGAAREDGVQETRAGEETWGRTPLHPSLLTHHWPGWGRVANTWVWWLLCRWLLKYLPVDNIQVTKDVGCPSGSTVKNLPVTQRCGFDP